MPTEPELRNAPECFALNPGAEVVFGRMGREGVPLIVIDAFLDQPERLEALAHGATFGPHENPYYPGLGAEAPQAYMAEILTCLRPSFARAFGVSQTVRLAVHSVLALASWKLEQFVPYQRIPHYDYAETDSLAMVHYLGRGPSGGTGFFRHAETGFETVTAERRNAYWAVIDPWMEAHGRELDGFTGPKTAGFEMIHAVEARFNRVIIYPANVLHCALFEGAVMSSDPRQGRLTLNSFFRAI